MLEGEYRRQAFQALRRALLRVQQEQRTAYWQEKMQPDEWLDPLRPLEEFMTLDREVRENRLDKRGGTERW